MDARIDSHGGTAELFLPWRGLRAYAFLLVLLAALFGIACYIESNQVLQSQIALGLDPQECAQAVAGAIGAELLILAVLAIRLRRSLLAKGELHVSASTLMVFSNPRSAVRNVSTMQRIRCLPTGANVQLAFPEGTVKLPGEWLPPGWKRSWRGWLDPGGNKVRLTRKTHPLLQRLRTLRPDLTPRLAGIWPEITLALLGALAPKISALPLYNAARSARPSIDDVAIREFQDGKYLKACDGYRKAVPKLRRDLYASEHAADFLIYCGDAKAALRASIGFDGQPLWPGPLDPQIAARIWIFRGKFARAEAALRGHPVYLLYVALVDQGRHAEADEVLQKAAERDGLAKVLLLRHRLRGDESQDAADRLCSTFLTHKPTRPSWLARVFESCILSGGVAKVSGDERFASALGALPGLRSELIRFTEREAPESARELKSAIQKFAPTGLEMRS